MTIDSVSRGRCRATIHASVFLVLTFFFLGISNYFVGVYDEGLIYTGTFRVLNGDIPSRDFYTVYGPGQFYALAGLFKIFGANVLVARIYDSVIAASIVFISYLSLKRFVPGWYSLCGSLCVIAVLSVFQLDLYPVNPVLAISIAFASILVFLLERESSAFPFIFISIGIAFAMVFRYDIAIMLCVAYGVPIALHIFINSRIHKDSFSKSFWQTIHIFFILGTVPLITIFFLIEADILIPAIKDILKYDSKSYVQMRSLPFPGIHQFVSNPIEFIFIYFPIFSAIIAFITIALIYAPLGTCNSASTERLTPIIVFTSLTCFFFVKGWVRTSGHHMLLSNIPAVLLCFMCTYHLGYLWIVAQKQKFIQPTKITIQAGVWIVSLTFLVYMLRLNFQSGPLHRYNAKLAFNKELPSVSIFQITKNQRKAALYIKNNTKEQERIHSATGRHDKIFVNDALVYFLSQRMPASKWHHYEPGLQNSANIQKEIISELERNEVSLVMSDSSWDDVREPNKSAESSNVFILDQYLQMHFHKEISFDKITIYRKN
jgi:hypothetical protein